MNPTYTPRVFSHRRLTAARAPGTWIPILCSVLLALSGCDSRQLDGTAALDGDHYGVTATWDSETQTLNVSGKTEHDDDGVEIHDATDDTLLGSAVVNADGTWSATASTPACRVHVSLPSGKVTKAVEGAPADCKELSDKTGGAVMARALPSTSPDATNNPEPLSDIPNGLILRPERDVTINSGEAVEFEARASGGNTLGAVSYSWSFGGATQNTTVQNPGSVSFSNPGVYNVSLSVVDAAGIPDPTPAVRTIVVNGPNFSVQNLPVPVIMQPTAVGGGVSINVGDSLYFSGSANDPTGASAFNYEWDFSGAAPPQFVPTPGNVLFARAGTFRCSLSVTNQLGIRSPQPAFILVNVGNGSGVGGFANQAPVGAITSPRRDITVNVGDAVNFEGRGRDPDNNAPLSYSWDFGNAATPIFNSPNSNAGPVRFQSPGVYAVSLRVADALGAVDPNPPVRTVTVLPVNGLPPGGSFPPGNTTLAAGIISPPTNVSIQPGQAVFFSGQAPVAGVNNYRYLWTFGGGAPTSSALTPGSITFSVPGQYVVEFMVADLQGNIIGIPDSRIITVGGFVPPGIPLPPGGTPPATATIISPADNSSINVGTPVNLLAQAPINQGFGSLSYEWEIALRSAGTATPIYTSNQMSPPPFVFQQPGRYRVSFRVRGMDQLGNFTILARATNRVTVTAGAGGGVGPVNLNAIAFPAQDMVLNIGAMQTFQAGIVNGSNLQYQWDFGGLAQPSFQPTPAPILLNRQGTFVITLRITGVDFSGIPVNLFGQRIITVVSGGGIPPPVTQPPVGGFATPDGIIDTPRDNMTVRVGQPVPFSGRGFDPNGGAFLRYQWSFGGAAPNIISANPGTVTFTQVGSYVVSLLVINQQGIPDPNPPHVVITVTP